MPDTITNKLQNSTVQDVIATKLARAVFAGFEAMFATFLNITLGAQSRFEQRQYHEVQSAMRERLQVYERQVKSVSEAVKVIAYAELSCPQTWQLAKNIYGNMVKNHENEPIAHTFFNSTFGAIWDDKKIRTVHLFVLKAKYRTQPRPYDSLVKRISLQHGFNSAIKTLITNQVFRVPFSNLNQDVATLQATLTQGAKQQCRQVYELINLNDGYIEYAYSHFYRNKACYLIGRCIAKNGDNMPFAIAILNTPKGLKIDAVMMGADQLSLLFGFARTYFMVDTDQPARYVDYLSVLMPHKQRFELFNAIGFIKHAKTEFYRYKVDTTKNSPASFKYVAAPGTPGMVMLVFTIAGSDHVYKVIKDKFSAPKTATKAQVKEKYNFVKQADRVGRLVDTHEFRYLAFDLSRFSEQLLQQMKEHIGSSLIISGKALILKHVYVERKMTPLNLYINDCDSKALAQVMLDYGRAIKDLAGANIFPGDMLMKNFGVTRWGRVVFYDYDEICPLTDCNFREVPQTQNALEELSSDSYFDIEPNDIFPSQFKVFFSANELAFNAFNSHHSDLFNAQFWQTCQQQVQQGYLPDVYPYKQSWRFK
ncbi:MULTISPECIES: bifunctional isocitrate dehydrogenase kinase/phosphatase [Pseudoalteromonas]|uniref:Isocitrate dehydrogenase kinase/phosphatase 1 n=3 Tax=Pseudoalteromonas TaxID=53246 RepID=ACEK1_PSET1|nr:MULTISPECIES: bifunctional isocitrate dehydrogenase kinase/phosphatase [Pseudoalteromonas]Q3IKY9.1 RecName: Full=Isocitrate dehydrogenase kinase/phosphatase 1; Short=IDH kinase/phosphatase 1; Short=IDHK/P 1 [Pseudoalteromonas translucida TAC125]ASM53848.1 isocitrate dehydrogenase kinase/phosphatase [Pseudoalteromonas nigrifaciens]MBB1370128.1 bifunctional isocitrate dehydrogenase kinase/phosphatase [Pseudoalteromonas sp. SR45-4]MBH0092748.1 bifunctional isocitrate dehydrogenase kinase/phosph|tara:strand:+ start:42895 stop:44673 length:1779 start_codon:yes stop_codon:yes gene_type:complete